MKIAFLFSGQGSQYVGMGKDLYEQYEIARQVFDSIQVDFDVKQLCFEGPQDKLQDTRYVQACIYSVSMAIAEILKQEHIHADVCAGLSLGEYSAYAYSNAISILDGAKILQARGALMASSLDATTGMCAVLFLEEDKVKKACQKASVYGVCEVANYNCPGQIVITGEQAALQYASELCYEYGAKKVVPLSVSGAFHSSLLKEASKTLKEELKKYDWGKTNIPVYNNINGLVNTDDTIDLLTQQLYQSVYFEKTILQMYQDQVDVFIEIGPGNTITQFVKKILKKCPITALHIENVETLQKAIQTLKEK